MTKIAYTYEIVAVTKDSIEVAYTNDTHGTLTVGTRRPREGETLEDVVAQASPALWWDEISQEKIPVELGATGNGETITGPEPIPVLSPEEELEFKRSMMFCSPMQGILALGETQWNKVLTYRDTATWQEKVIIDSAQDWQRLSENIAFFQYLLDLTDEQTDDLFIAAGKIKA